ncbi:VP3 protein [Wanken orbivirus]|nr:VP3 protein [Wanken orbivirus]
MTEPQNRAPYLQGTTLCSDTGPLLSVFALQEILEKVREAQSALAVAAKNIDGATPDAQRLITQIAEMADVISYRVENKPMVSYRHITADSKERFFQVDTFYERMSQVGEITDERDPTQFFDVLIAKVRHLKKEGSFILWDVPTEDFKGRELVREEALGIDLGEAPRAMLAADRQIIRTTLENFFITNAHIDGMRVDSFQAAMSEPVYRIHSVLQAYIARGQRAEFRQALGWLELFGERKRVDFSQSLLTDFRRADTFYVLSYLLPPNPLLIWSVPRSGVSNLIFNIALCVPNGDYVVPNPRTATITLTQRVTQISPFSIIINSTPTHVQMDDVRKITLAMLFPSQIVLDIREDLTHSIDPVTRMIAGVVGKLMFTHGPNFTNLTPSSVRKLDAALADFFRHMVGGNVDITQGPTNRPLDFTIGRRQRYDCSRLIGNGQTGAGYNGAGIIDVEYENGPYPHARRIIKYGGLEYKDILDERTSGDTMTYTHYDEMIRALNAAEKINEASYLKFMRPHHMVRLAYINQIINQDLLSAFSIPDHAFRQLLLDLLDGVHVAENSIVLEIGYVSIWHAFHTRFLPTSRSESLAVQPLVESVYASELAVMKYDMQKIVEFRTAYPDNVTTTRPSHVWKSVLKNTPEPIKEVMNLIQMFEYVNVQDIMTWVRNAESQDSLSLYLERTAWDVAQDVDYLMLTDQVYLHRSELPEPRLDDIDRFKREGFYYTNALDAAPPLAQMVRYDRTLAMGYANEGNLKNRIRAALDEDLYIRFGNMLRSVKISIYDSRPPTSVLEALPFKYIEKKEILNYATVEYSSAVVMYYLIYKVDYSDTPDCLVSINPTYTMTTIFMRKRIVTRVETRAILAVVNKNLIAFKKRMRVLDITKVLRAGTRLAVAQVV